MVDTGQVVVELTAEIEGLIARLRRLSVLLGHDGSMREATTRFGSQPRKKLRVSADARARTAAQKKRGAK